MATGDKIRIAILGASGYTGAELIRILLSHPSAELSVLTGNTQAGQSFYTVFPQFSYAKVSHAFDSFLQAPGTVSHAPNALVIVTNRACLYCHDTKTTTGRM
jgi:N-acetyl-gamma-glutamylphosphate reductase